MISEFTALTAAKEFLLRELDMIRVKGKQHPIRIFEIVSTWEEASDEILSGMKIFHSALECYRKQHWSEAIALFEKASGILPNDPPSLMYAGRCREFMVSPPGAEWDGVYTMKGK
jgi:adenylate cyclase